VSPAAAKTVNLQCFREAVKRDAGLQLPAASCFAYHDGRQCGANIARLLLRHCCLSSIDGKALLIETVHVQKSRQYLAANPENPSQILKIGSKTETFFS
jgi:hypothetical protein